MTAIAKIRRGYDTEKKIRSMDASDIVDWIHALEDRAYRYEELLEELDDDYFADRVDADCEGDPPRFIPNEEMVWQQRIREVIGE